MAAQELVIPMTLSYEKAFDLYLHNGQGTFGVETNGATRLSLVDGIVVEVYDRLAYEEREEDGLIFGFTAPPNSDGRLIADLSYFVTLKRRREYLYSEVCRNDPAACDLLGSGTEEGLFPVYDLQYFRRYLHTAHLYKQSLDPPLPELYSLKSLTLDVVVVISATGNANLEDIKKIYLPGMEGPTTLDRLSFLRTSVLSDFFSDGARNNFTMLAAHRGYWADAGISENTIKASELALELGADMLEVDIRTSSDGVPMLLHDPCIIDETTGEKNLSIKSLTAAELKTHKTYDRFGVKTAYNINSLEELLDRFKGKTLITLDIKDTGVEWDNTFMACLRLIAAHNQFNEVVIKGPADREKIEFLMSQVSQDITFDKLQYTPVLYGDRMWKACYGGENSGGSSGSGSGGSGGSGTADGSSIGGSGSSPSSGGQLGPQQGGVCFEDFKTNWYPLIKAGKIKVVETHIKLNTDPIIGSGVLEWLKNHGVRIGVFPFVADDPEGVVNTNNSCETTVRNYFHNQHYERKVKAEFLNDGRGNIDWLMKTVKPSYIITDRPDLWLEYLSITNNRNPLVSSVNPVGLPEDIALFTPPANGVQDWASHALSSNDYGNFQGMALKITDYEHVDFFIPDNRDVKVKTAPIEVGLNRLEPTPPNPETGVTYLPKAPQGADAFYTVTKANVKERFYNNKDASFQGTCAQMYDYGSGTIPMDLRGQPFSGPNGKFKFPNRQLNEWAKIYPGYEVYLNSNYWSTNGWTGEQSARDRMEFCLPCTDVYGLMIVDGVKLSDIVEHFDPSGRKEGAYVKVTDQTPPGNRGDAMHADRDTRYPYYDGRFDVLAIYEDGEVEIIPIGDVANHLTADHMFRTQDNEKIKFAVSGYVVLGANAQRKKAPGTIIPRSNINQRFNNDAKFKQRTVIGINTSTREMYLVTINKATNLTTGQVVDGLTVEQVALLMKNHFGCDMAINMDSGRSVSMLTNATSTPGVTVDAPGYLLGGSIPNGLDQKHLEQFFGKNAQVPYRNSATFLAIKEK